MSEVVRTLNNEVTSLTERRPFNAIREKVVDAKTRWNLTNSISKMFLRLIYLKIKLFPVSKYLLTH